MGTAVQAMKPLLWQGKPVRRRHMIVKPTGPVCNLGYSSCPSLAKQSLLTTKSRWRMTEEVVEAFIRQYFQVWTSSRMARG